MMLAALLAPVNEAQRQAEAEEHFHRCMAIWRSWMHAKGNVRPRGISRFDSVCGGALTNYMAAEGDSELVYDKADSKLAQVVDACVESLMPHERLAVYIHYRLARVWPFLGLSQAQSLETGMIALRRLVAKRC